MPVGNTKPYFKAAFEGFAGSGKTYTAAQVAIGIHKRIGSTKPVIMFDTEKAAKFLKKAFADAGIELLIRESRSLSDLKETMKRIRESKISDILIIDSISHIWESTVETYKKGKGRDYLTMQDWGVLKPTWKREFSDPFVRDEYHVIMCGRAGYEYDQQTDANGKKEFVKSGVKMKVEGETAYESDMIVLMERFEEVLGEEKKAWREATIIKDRSTLIDGKTFKNPTYKDFSPVIEDMLLNPETFKQSEQTDTSELFPRNDDERANYGRTKDITLEEIEGQLLRAWPSKSVADNQAKLDTIDKVFETRSWTFLTTKGVAELQAGLASIREIVEAELIKQFPDKNAVSPNSEAKKEIKKITKKADKAVADFEADLK